MSPIEEQIRIAEIIRRIDRLTPMVKADGWATYTRLVAELTDRIESNYPEPCWQEFNLGLHHQLPCGCIGATIEISHVYHVSRCLSCERGWHHMRGDGAPCKMWDGQPQGEPVFVLQPEMILGVDKQDESS